ncbi:MAG: hypothetical protein ABGZ17_32355 [Planctomycetaceae bacterium]
MAFLFTGAIDVAAAGNGQPHRPHFDPAARELPDRDPGPAARRGRRGGPPAGRLVLAQPMWRVVSV